MTLNLFRRYSVPLLFAWGILLRLVDLRQPFRGIYAWNEAYYTTIAVNFAHYGWRHQWGPDGPLFTSNPLVPWLIAASLHHFGIHEWAARLPFFVCSVVSLVALYGLVRCAFPARPALARLCLLFAATMPGIVFFSRNVQLDGPMTAAGLTALWAAAYARQSGRRWPIVLSVLLMAVCITVKYTGVLALPAWWITLGLHRTQWRRALLLSFLVVMPAAFAAHWVSTLQAASGTTVHGLTTHSYFFRFSEWKPSAFVQALLTTWNIQANHWGAILWYPFLLGIPLLAILVTPARLRHARLALAMILPWYLQMAYPVSWVVNEYYDYCALYGIALALALIVDAMWRRLPSAAPGLRLPVWTSTFAFVLIATCNFWQYHQTFHQSYFPDNLVADSAPFASAKLVHQLDTDRALILTDQSQTLFYANPDPAVTTYLWGPNNEAEFDAEIAAQKPQYVVVAYMPSIPTLETLMRSHYRRIAAGAWERSGS